MSLDEVNTQLNGLVHTEVLLWVKTTAEPDRFAMIKGPLERDGLSRYSVRYLDADSALFRTFGFHPGDVTEIKPGGKIAIDQTSRKKSAG